MPEEANDEIGSFGYGIRVIRRSDGRIEYQPTTIVKNIPIEIVIMQMQVFLDDLKKEYYDKHGQKPPKSEE